MPNVEIASLGHGFAILAYLIAIQSTFSTRGRASTAADIVKYQVFFGTYRPPAHDDIAGRCVPGFAERMVDAVRIFRLNGSDLNRPNYLPYVRAPNTLGRTEPLWAMIWEIIS